ncbi:MAG: hypothetical protein P1U61_00680 [Legionellaceae bacterium]|nr:hypothetical protein [Legionellaceae bacterium]
MMRNMAGYRGTGSGLIWPNSARIAVHFVVNDEEGAENLPIYGDAYAV